MNTKTLRITHGSQARITTSRGCLVKVLAAAPAVPAGPAPTDGELRATGISARASRALIGAPIPAAASGGNADAERMPPRLEAGAPPATLDSRRWPSDVEVQIVFGFQTRRNRIRQTIELIAAITSTSSGPM